MVALCHRLDAELNDGRPKGAPKKWGGFDPMAARRQFLSLAFQAQRVSLADVE